MPFLARGPRGHDASVGVLSGPREGCGTGFLLGDDEGFVARPRSAVGVDDLPEDLLDGLSGRALAGLHLDREEGTVAQRQQVRNG
ncbi:hypothetical protein [Microvirga sp. TS319]|uniref:hypothetical protein n=1 Tax=Microvirga sp. TS319 TaxID=3241165 RepID=UPI00351A2E05